MIDNDTDFNYYLTGKGYHVSHIHSPGFVEQVSLEESSSLEGDTFKITVRLATGLPEEYRVVDLSFPVEYVTDLL
jgi:hypothetical protein